jgi:hypothetical protein
MKNNRFKSIFFIIVISLFASCYDDIKVDAIIKNETIYTLKISGYVKNSVTKTFIIAPKSVYKERVIAGGFKTQSGGIFDGYFTDSVTIDFDDKRRIVQKCPNGILSTCNFPKNINSFFLNQERDKKKIRKGYYLLPAVTLTFDQSDYDKAVPIVK